MAELFRSRVHGIGLQPHLKQGGSKASVRYAVPPSSCTWHRAAAHKMCREWKSAQQTRHRQSRGAQAALLFTWEQFELDHDLRDKLFCVKSGRMHHLPVSAGKHARSRTKRASRSQQAGQTQLRSPKSQQCNFASVGRNTAETAPVHRR
jgi:hypothetical protein